MAYTDDAVKAKLSSLNETQEGIVTVAQWIMFHRRYADRTAQLWMQRLKDSNASKRLNLIYLANEVIQQSKARKKDEFVRAFSPIIAESTAVAYKGSPAEVQQKLRRVIEVWRSRQIFDTSVQDGIEARADELDKNRTSGRKPALGGSLFSSSTGSAPPEIQPLVTLQTNLTKAEITQTPAITNANSEYEKLINSTNPVPTPPVHAARLSGLLKSLSNAEGAVAESIKTRQALIEGLEGLIKTNQEALAKDEAQKAELTKRKIQIETKKREVEDAIMRGLSSEPQQDLAPEPPRPEVEGLTPPPVESLTPTGTPPPMPAYVSTTGADVIEEQPPTHEETFPPTDAPLPQDPRLFARSASSGAVAAAEAANAAVPVLSYTRSAEAMNGNGNGVHVEDPRRAVKRRKTSGTEEDDFARFLGEEGTDGIDEDVAEMLKQ
ncbi:DUF618-domain-containing protein [Rhizodiscina lignyota]|uniref:DUF618-domain-containing protein n=1 Tax=Rhizodiscina lignyota TaxID=1504668 RepID=A0A9P4MGK0_9PEZI|nr:DUF618-domain-containing protein [Rhizodiscina lignyota]